MHPYEMYQTLIQRHEDRIVKVRPGSLYHTIGKLERLGAVRAVGTEREGNRPERTTYAITEKGRLTLAEWIAETIETPVNEFPAFPVAISNASDLPRETVIDLLNRRTRALESQLDELVVARDRLTGKNLPRRHWLDVAYLESQGRAELTWLRGMVDEISSGALAWEDEPAPDHGPPSPSHQSSPQHSAEQESR